MQAARPSRYLSGKPTNKQLAVPEALLMLGVIANDTD
jgi:hypothetical protein